MFFSVSVLALFCLSLISLDTKLYPKTTPSAPVTEAVTLTDPARNFSDARKPVKLLNNGHAPTFPATIEAVSTSSLTAPQELTARASSVRAMAISWQPVEGAEGYTIEKSSNGPAGPFQPLATVPEDVRYFRETDLALSQTVTYRVKATAEGQDSPYAMATGTTNPDEVVRIMPLGDSNTEGGSGETVPEAERIGYRLELYRQLFLRGRDEDFRIDLVGSQQMGQDYEDAFLQENGFALDLDHAGFGGARDEDIALLLRDGRFEFYSSGTFRGPGGGPYLDPYSPDIILLHIGTNEVDGSETAMQDMAAILDEVDRFEARTGKETLVIVAKVIQRVCYVDASGFEHCPYPDAIEQTDQYNRLLEAYVQERNAAGDRLLLVDMEQGAGITYTYTFDGGDMEDPLHPAQSGYDKMAQVWLEALASPAVPLPVELMSFAARASDMEVILDWSTASEQDNSHFVIERMEEGGSFTRIGAVAGAGNSSRTLYYSYHDTNAPAGQLYYRLRQVDEDGAYTFSNTVSARRVVSESASLQIFPNPGNAGDAVTLVATGFTKNTPVQVSLRDTLGRQLYLETFLSGTQGELRVTIQLSPTLPKGLYFLELALGQMSQFKKLLIR